MIKKVLIGLIIVLSFILIGLLILYFYSNNNTNKKNSILIFVPSQTELILRIKETSKTANAFMSNPIVSDCLNFEELKKYWSTIDSITSRNYKTAEILLNNTSYICIDSSFNYLILVDLNNRANEHFIDQFLANSTSPRKIEKFKEGHKAFYLKKDQPIYYFVKQNVFGVSKNSDYLKQSLENSITEKVDSLINSWNNQTSASLSVWGLKGTETKVLNTFMKGDSIFGGWLDKFSNSFWFNIFLEDKKISFQGELLYDSLNTEIQKFGNSKNENDYLLYQSDTVTYKNAYYNFFMSDSLQKMQSVSFVHHHFKDTAGTNIDLLVSNSPLTLQFYKSAIYDTSVQLIPMADAYIKEIAVMNRQIVSQLTPLVPLQMDSVKLFVTIYHDYLFIATSTEILLNHASSYPNSNFMKKEIGNKTFLFSNYQIQFKQFYQVQYKYQWEKKNKISFSSEIKKTLK